MKMDMTKQQAELDKVAGQHRFEVVGRETGKKVTQDQLDKTVTLHMGTTTRHMMTSMMSGHVDNPITTLTVMKKVT